MSITITQSHEGFLRYISVKVTAEGSKKIRHVESTYDGFRLGSDSVQPPASVFANTYRQQEGISPGRDRVVIVTAKHTDGSSDSGQLRWRD
ncbi:MAG TPA: hypothetical protein VF787_07675 [Thermoanaerobaculia bacterium]